MGSRFETINEVRITHFLFDRLGYKLLLVLFTLYAIWILSSLYFRTFFEFFLIGLSGLCLVRSYTHVLFEGKKTEKKIDYRVDIHG